MWIPAKSTIRRCLGEMIFYKERRSFFYKERKRKREYLNKERKRKREKEIEVRMEDGL